jgi:hypothetical protein
MEIINDKIIYALTVEDLQVVSKVIYGKELSSEQIEVVSDKVGDFFSDWFEKVEFAIDLALDLEKLEKPDWDEYPY